MYGKYSLVSILRIVDSCQSNNIELSSGVNMDVVSLHQRMAAIVVDESHTVETWTGKR